MKLRNKFYRKYNLHYLYALCCMVLAIITLAWVAISRILSPYYAIKSYKIPISIIVSKNENNILRIGSFNIAHARGQALGASNWQYQDKAPLIQHLEDIATQIKNAQLDVIVLNEIDFSASWSFNVNQAYFIAEKAGYPNVVEQRNMDVAIPFYDFRFGNALLSRYPVVESKHIRFTPYSKLENVILGNHDGVLSVLQTPLGQIGVLAVHLDYRSEDIRVQAAYKIKKLSDGTPMPIIAVGDFNSSPEGFPGAKTIASGINALSYLLNKGGFQVHPSVINESTAYTFPSTHPRQVIDWILEKGQLKFIDSRVVRSKLSDHFMLTATLIVADAVRENQ